MKAWFEAHAHGIAPTRASESRDYERMYSELVDALCSPGWLGRYDHKRVLALAARLKVSQGVIVPMESDA